MAQPRSNRIVLAMTGASGAIYGLRLIEILIHAGVELHLTLSNAAIQVFRSEFQCEIDLKDFEADPESAIQRLCDSQYSTKSTIQFERGKLTYHASANFMAGIASGSFKTDGMVICPCSMGTLASLANGISTNLTHRAADVHLKERRRLIVVPRETPLGSISLQNMKTLSDAGAVILPAMPGFYHNPDSILDLVDFVVTRICDQLGVEIDLTKRWGS